MRILIHNLFWLWVFVVLSACGQKGDLYLPAEPVIAKQTDTRAHSPVVTPSIPTAAKGAP